MTLGKYEILNDYKMTAKRLLKLSFPSLGDDELDVAINWSIDNRLKNTNIKLYNNYKDKEMELSLLDLTQYIIERQPIVTSYGCMFARHANSVNPIAKLLETFMDGRDIHKSEMFKYPKGSEMFERYNLLQLLDKRDSNSIYGVLGNATSVYYNLYVAATITTQGRSMISATGLQFEMFLNNNVDFASLDEIVTFIDNIRNELITYKDNMILDNNISLEKVWYKICATCGFGYIPSQKDLQIVWDILSNCNQYTLNRLYYKNNLFEFIDNRVVSNILTTMLTKLEVPFVNPNKLPDSIKSDMESFMELLKEYVYYKYPIIDKIGKYSTMMRSVSLLTDTDSVIVSLDGWYRYVLEKVKDIDMNIKHVKTDIVEFMKPDEFGEYDISNMPKYEYDDTELSYDFFTDEIIDIEKSCAAPLDIIPQDGVRYSIINIIAYCLTHIVNDYIERYTHYTNSFDEGKKCLLYLKNEFLFKSMILAAGKKNYASIQELQEGNVVGNKLDIKGLPMAKSTVNESTQERLKKIMYEDILNVDNISQVKIIKDLAVFEKQIFDSLNKGEKTYYTPRKIRSLGSYDDPMRIFGIKQAIVWNTLKDDSMEALDLEVRNSLDIVKLDINLKNIEDIKDTYPEEYTKTVELLNRPEFKGVIVGIGVPKNALLPVWLRQFINYAELINDNISNFPVELVGIQRGNASNNYTNIIQI